MIFAYIRVSTDKQTNENQRFELNGFAKKRGWKIETWVEETISALKKLEHRKLGELLKKLRAGDILLVSEISRLGRNLMQIMSILNQLLERDIQVFTAKEGYELGNNISSKILAFAFGLSAEIERNLISQRTKEALARKKAEGVVLGRPKGSKSSRHKLSGKDDKIKQLLLDGISISGIGRITKTHRLTVAAHIMNTPELLKIRPLGSELKAALRSVA
ncbi:master DNA invertase Mpi family serine-type recombinase [Hymenobacter baengnokdamensis]|uniref:master DNA invertase Mpi family serine-type recombinase n=1 Tax=Hymenobacter baengnokdamensis TaxID=2615203 RepID=UPI00124554C5|nr:master DNA invertase Mpi family serine-type recombinase [Hymenobacter baengnokdamensis]